VVGYLLRRSDIVRLYSTVHSTQMYTEFETGVSNGAMAVRNYLYECVSSSHHAGDQKAIIRACMQLVTSSVPVNFVLPAIAVLIQ